MKNLTTSIYSKASGSNFLNAVGGRFFKGFAPEGEAYPYALFFVVSDIPEYPGCKTVEQYLIQFSIYSITSSSLEVETALTYLRTLYDWCTLTITDNTSIYFMRDNFTSIREDHTTPSGTIGVWHYSQEYRGWMVAN